MKWLVLCSLLLVAFVAADEEVEDIEELPLAEACDHEQCKLPDCLCSSTSIPGGLAPRDTPQFVTVTFDDGINVENIGTYRNLLYGRSNTNGCPASATFYVNHEYTDYTLVNELYNNGFEIALHSISHQTPSTYWAEATYEIMVKEFAEQKVQMAHFANIPIDELKGMRIPFLQLAGNASFQMMAGHGLVYDSSWPTITHTNPGLWPYTLDFASIQDCPVEPCPTASIPGVWVAPMVVWIDLEGFPCAMVDSCFANPNTADEEAWFRYILTNFERHYLGNRAPFGFFIHEWYVRTNPAVHRALVRFLDLINNLQDAFLVNASEVIDWVKDPQTIDEYKQKSCRNIVQTICPASTCPLVSEHNLMQYWMSICNVCPARYPWLGNPLGQ